MYLRINEIVNHFSLSVWECVVSLTQKLKWRQHQILYLFIGDSNVLFM